LHDQHQEHGDPARSLGARRGSVRAQHQEFLTNKGLSLSARISYLLSYSYWWSFGRRLVFTFAPIMFALFDLQVVNTTFWEILAIWGPQYIFYTLAIRSLSSDTRNQRWNQIIDTILAPFMVIPYCSRPSVSSSTSLR
jgi:cellulose synthase (UDP-forming)